MKLTNRQFYHFIAGALGMLTYIQAVPLKAASLDNSCDCQKNINYLREQPPLRLGKGNRFSAYGYKLEGSPKAKTKVANDLDSTLPMPPKKKLDISAKKNPKKTNKNANFTPSSKHGNSASNKTPTLSSHIMAIILEPWKQMKVTAARSRNKRDLTDILRRPLLKQQQQQQHSDRLIKQYNKRLKELLGEKTPSIEFPNNPHRFKGIPATTSTLKSSLKRLRNLLTSPSLRIRRGIKGEYDLLEEEGPRMYLTLPEVIQYMPEFLDSNFQRSHNRFIKSLQHPDALDSSTTSASTTETATAKTTTEYKGTMSGVTEANHMQYEERDIQTNNAKSLKNTKRYAEKYSLAMLEQQSKPNSKAVNIYESKQRPIASPNKQSSSVVTVSKDSISRREFRNVPKMPKAPAKYILKSLRIGPWKGYNLQHQHFNDSYL